MTVDEHGLEAIRNAAEYVDPSVSRGHKNKYIKVAGLDPNDPNFPLPPVGVYIVEGEHGTPFFGDIQDTTISGASKTLFSIAVPVSTKRMLKRLYVSCRQSVKFNLEVDGAVVATLRTGPAQKNDVFIWDPDRGADAGKTIELKAIQSHGPSTDCEAYLLALDQATS